MSTARRRTSLIVGVVMLTVAAGTLIVRYVDITGHYTLYAVIAAPYLMPSALIALLAFVWGRLWVWSVVAVCMTAALVAPQLVWYVGTDSGESDIPLRAMTINMLYGEADAHALTDVATANADVVTVQELTPEAVRNLAAAGMADVFPYSALDARAQASGVGIYSRFPLTDITRIPGYALAMVNARVHVDGVRDGTAVVALHFAAPWPQQVDGWRDDLTRFRQTLADLAAQSHGAPIVIGGDFNATADMRQFRDLLTNGYRDAAEQAGEGRQLTYPANKRIPRFMGIDHFLTRDCTAVTSHTVEVPGSDHRAVLATVMLPRAASA